VVTHQVAKMTTTSDLLVNLDIMFLLVMGMIVYLMQGGFAFLEAGSVRSKNTSNILIKNLLDSFVAGISYWCVGYPLAFGNGNSFIGWENWASSGLENERLAFWFFQFVFAATAATIVSGALAERCEFVAYFVYSSILTAFIYPVVTRWAWHEEGWLNVGSEYSINNVTVSVGYQDFAGSGVVHCVGGAAAFVGAALMGPRLGRFHEEDGKTTVVPIRGHSVPFAALGGFILLFGFMAFNGGSQTSISNPGDGAVVSLAVVNTVISGSMSAFTTLLFVRIKEKHIFHNHEGDEMSGLGTHKWSLLSTINGALAGMVAICAGCNVIRPWGACCVGVVAGLIMNLVSWAMIKGKIDDPLDAVAVHLGGGIWGCLAVALFRYDDTDSNGLFIDGDKEAVLMLAWQLAGVASIIGWTSGLCFLMFGFLKVIGKLRVDPELEKKGLDIPKHGEPAYPLESYGHGYLERVITILENGHLGTTAMGLTNHGFTNDAHHHEGSEQYRMAHHNGPPHVLNHKDLQNKNQKDNIVISNGNGKSNGNGAKPGDDTRM